MYHYYYPVADPENPMGEAIYVSSTTIVHQWKAGQVSFIYIKNIRDPTLRSATAITENAPSAKATLYERN